MEWPMDCPHCHRTGWLIEGRVPCFECLGGIASCCDAAGSAGYSAGDTLSVSKDAVYVPGSAVTVPAASRILSTG